MEIWLGGWPFAVLVLIVTGLMVWELARMTDAEGALPAVGLGGLAGLALLAAIPPLVTLPLEWWFKRRGLLSVRAGQ